MKIKGSILGVLIAILLVAFTSAYVVDETQQVVITQFGEVIGEAVQTPGLKFKIPFVQQANYFPKNLLEWDGDKGEIPTLNKTYIWVDTFARWKIVDPVLFFQTANNVYGGMERLGEIIDPAVKNLIASYPLIEAVRNSNREMESVVKSQIQDERKEAVDKTAVAVSYQIEAGREEISRLILEQAVPKVAGFGIELVDVKIKRINYREDVRASVYERMIAERTQIVEKFRAEGKGDAQKILGEKEKELKQITSEAYKKARILIGEADAAATKIYAEAYKIDPEFYSFTKTMDIYRKSFDDKSTIIFSTESEFLKYLKGMK